MLSMIALALLGLLLLGYAADFVIASFDDPKEPPRVRAKFPLIGHLFGFLSKGTGYYHGIGPNVNADMYTLGVLHYKIYVCNSRRMMPLIQRQGKTLSFAPFAQMAVKKYADASDRTVELHKGPMYEKIQIATKSALAPGEGLDDQNLRTGQELLSQFDQLVDGAREGDGKAIWMLEWVRMVIMQASSAGIFGMQHPFRDPSIMADFWIWQDHIPYLISGLDFLAKKGWAARERIFVAFRAWRAKGIPSDAALIVKERDRVFRADGIPSDEAAQLDTSFCVAIFANTSPTTFWFLWEVFSRPAILEELRQELRDNALGGSKEEGLTLDLAALKSRCPLLLSLLEETQRTRHIHANIRIVTEDTVLDGYLLKKDSYLQMPGSLIHHDRGIYGEDAESFDPYRFIPKPGQKELPGSSFLAWGAPPHLCPARQFASTEVMIIAAMFALRFDMRPVKGEFELAPPVRIGEVVTVLGPKRDERMWVREREEFLGGKWELKMSESKSRIHLASG